MCNLIELYCFNVEGKLEEHEGNYIRCLGVGTLSGAPETKRFDHLGIPCYEI